MPKKFHLKIATEDVYPFKVSHIFSGEDSGNQFWAVANSQTSEEVATLVAEVFGCCLYKCRLQNLIVFRFCHTLLVQGVPQKEIICSINTTYLELPHGHFL